MDTIVLISCVKKKEQYPCKAEDLYISPFFKKNLAYAKSLNPSKIFILSAKYGLLELDRVIEPYEMTLKSFNKTELKQWSDNVIQQLKQIAQIEKDKFIILAGNKYRMHLLPYLKNYDIPLEGLGIGKQLQRLDNLLNE